MKKTIIFGLAGIMAVSAADAGWFSNLFNKKSTEPQSLEEACNKDEITSVCPETLLGQKTIIECLSENLTNLSDKCVTFVKKQISENIDAVVAQKDSVTTQVADIKDSAKADVAEQKAATKTAVQNLKDAAVATKDAAKQIVNTK